MIRPATKGDILRCFDKGVIAATGVSPESVDSDNFLAVEIDGFVMCALVYRDESDAEVHPVIPRESALKSREMCLELLHHLAENGAENVYTCITNEHKKAINLAKKLGFVEVKTDIYRWSYGIRRGTSRYIIA